MQRAAWPGSVWICVNGQCIRASADVTTGRPCGSGVKRVTVSESDLGWTWRHCCRHFKATVFLHPPTLNHHRKSTRCIDKPARKRADHQDTLPYSCTGCTAFHHFLHPPPSILIDSSSKGSLTSEIHRFIHVVGLARFNQPMTDVDVRPLHNIPHRQTLTHAMWAR